MDVGVEIMRNADNGVDIEAVGEHACRRTLSSVRGTSERLSTHACSLRLCLFAFLVMAAEAFGAVIRPAPSEDDAMVRCHASPTHVPLF